MKKRDRKRYRQYVIALKTVEDRLEFLRCAQAFDPMYRVSESMLCEHTIRNLGCLLNVNFPGLDTDEKAAFDDWFASTKRQQRQQAK